MHAAIFWGFLVLFPTIVIAMIGTADPHTTLPWLGEQGWYALLVDVFAVLVFARVVTAFVIRKVVRPQRFVGSHLGEADLILLLIAGIVITLVAFLHAIPAGIVVGVFVIVYQQIENHFLQPVIYGRTVQLSALAVLVSVLVGAELAGILGALAAIPVAGSLQVLIRDQLAYRRGAAPQPVVATAGEPQG